MIRSLHHKLHIPLESLIGSGALAADKRAPRTRQGVEHSAKKKTPGTSRRR
jgi:hypothetical protein